MSNTLPRSLPFPWGKVVLYQLSYVRIMSKHLAKVAYFFGAGRALPTGYVAIFNTAKVASIPFWGKVVLYQLSYVATFKTPCQGRFHWFFSKVVLYQLSYVRGEAFIRDCNVDMFRRFQGIDEVFKNRRWGMPAHHTIHTGAVEVM